MKKLFLFIIAIIFFYVSAGHNSVLAYCMLGEQSKNHSVHYHTTEVHECCSTVDVIDETISHSSTCYSIENEKTKKQIAGEIFLEKTSYPHFKNKEENSPSGTTYKSQKNIYVNLIGIIRNNR